ncbi:hypothetical protein ILUMI_01790 [Ignelater luminosus]|uniref:Uncharacterized protein n=1 Tax=Ignelater luminosus TaxID=2038154 RepID=A0A8K0DDW9_IGNLU|nr:hypothetical protein ILUMI_01790 [Ignelater luminosus]
MMYGAFIVEDSDDHGNPNDDLVFAEETNKEADSDFDNNVSQEGKKDNLHNKSESSEDNLPLFESKNNGKCTSQPVDVDIFGRIPREITTFLGLSNSQDYTEHCFRSSASLLVHTAADIDTLKRHGGGGGGWRSSKCCRKQKEIATPFKPNTTLTAFSDIGYGR